MFYIFARAVLRIFYRIFYPLQLRGSEHVPNEGPVLLCSNHISLLDPPAIGIYLKRKVSFFAKEELFKVPLLGAAIRRLGAIPVKRGAADRKALSATLQVLEKGGVVGIFPEGTRAKSGQVEAGKKGAAFFALRSQATVIPVGIRGPYKLFRKTTITYGPPIELSSYRNGKSAAAVTDEISDLIMEHIRRLV
ncbi:lysophospholipid acyltransferase family protein [Effusibacillus dendaii]|uniref:1-acyl-sn-glycerol-3-phosphate acyltransferase n=1 Tax=Effusibacillus dendaii TaxID=2743772 RepID=A0A7I8D5D7_9BACL|nr:lysophospholipid acyltransferase family protein [Effusibacillus dendaii]BCJ85363.1 1-acyl-sn-glycerol-3-phosphate acyltransferase [Effusibacillus dendaii]